MTMMFSSSDEYREEKLNSYYSTKYEIKKEIKSLLWCLSQKKDFQKDDCMDILNAVHTELFDKLDKINKK